MFSTDERTRRLDEALDRVRDKLGEASVVPAGSLAHMGEMGHVPFGVTGKEAHRKRDMPKGKK